MTAALSVKNVKKTFGNHVAVDDISFTVPRGVVYGILGPNGAGKSTTLRMINDIIAPDHGEIRIGDLPPGIAAAKHIGYLPEERGLYPKMKVGEIIELMGELRGLSRADAKQRGAAWIERLGLGKWMGNKVQDLSKGMQQKVQFATALLHEPSVVILDEPWSGLDPINAEVLREVVSEIRDSGRTVLFSTHQMEQAEKIVDALCIIARGKLVLEGTLRDLKAAARADGWIALAVADADREKTDAILADATLVSERRADAVKVSEPQRLLSALVGAGIAVERFEVVVPSLHQIFVERVGPEAAVAERREGDSDAA